MWTIPHERWDKGCSLLLSAGTEINMSLHCSVTFSYSEITKEATLSAFFEK